MQACAKAARMARARNGNPRRAHAAWRKVSPDGDRPIQSRARCRQLVAQNSKFRSRDNGLKALDMVAKMSELGKPLPQGWAQGIAIDDRRRPSKVTAALCADVVTIPSCGLNESTACLTSVLFCEPAGGPQAARRPDRLGARRHPVAGDLRQRRSRDRGQCRSGRDRPHGGLPRWTVNRVSPQSLSAFT